MCNRFESLRCWGRSLQFWFGCLLIVLNTLCLGSYVYADRDLVGLLLRRKSYGFEELTDFHRVRMGIGGSFWAIIGVLEQEECK